MGRVHLLNRAGVPVASDVVLPKTSGGPSAEEDPPRAALPERPAARRPDDVVPAPGGESEAGPPAAVSPGPGGGGGPAPRRGVRAGLARRIVAGQRSTGIRPVLEPLAAL